METSMPPSARRGLLRIAELLLCCTGAVLLSRALIGFGMAACLGEPLDWSMLFSAPIGQEDFYLPLFLFGFLAIELVQNGWQRSAMRRLLHRDDKATRTDLVYCAVTLTRLMPLIALVLTLGLNAQLKELEVGHGLAIFAGLPLWLAVPAVMLVQSFAAYWLHRLMHTPLLWPLHAVHHAATDFNVIVALRHHPLDGVLATFVLPLLPALLGFPIEAIVLTILAASAYTIFVHSELPTPAWLERFVAFGPNGHGIHHGVDAGSYNTNFGDFVIWDRLFGTYKIEVPVPLAYGCDDPDGIYQSGRPLRDMLAVQAACFRNLWRAVTAAVVRGNRATA